jgi:hypothetical protein
LDADIRRLTLRLKAKEKGDKQIHRRLAYRQAGKIEMTND